MSPLVEWIAGILGGGAGARYLYDIWTSRSRNRKTDAEGAVLLVNSATGYSEKLVKRIDTISKSFDEFRREQQELNDMRTRRDRLDDQLKLAHSRWDDKMVDVVRKLGGQIEDPPPLYPPEGITR